MKVERIEVVALQGVNASLLDISGKVAKAEASMNASGQLIYYFRGEVKLIITPKPKKPNA